MNKVWTIKVLIYIACEQIIVNFYLDTYNASYILCEMKEMRMNDSEMSKRWNDKAWSILEISFLRKPWWK